MSIYGGSLIGTRKTRYTRGSVYGGRRIVRRRRVHRGHGFFSNVFDKIKDIARHPSRLVSLIPHPAGRIAGSILGALGAGRRRRRRVVRHHRIGGGPVRYVPYGMSACGRRRKRRTVKRGGALATLIKKLAGVHHRRRRVGIGRRKRIHRSGRGVLLI